MVRAAPKTKADVIERIDTNWREFVAALDAIPDDSRTLPGMCGYWSVGEMVAHISYWESKLPEYAQRTALQLKSAANNVDAENWYVGKRVLTEPLPYLLRNLFTTHAQAMEVITGLADPVPDELLTGIACETWDHYPEHTDQIVSWSKTISTVGAQYHAVVTGTLALAETVPAAQRDETGVCGEWSLKDVVGHLAFWDIVRVDEINHSQGRLQAMPDFSDYEAINHVEADRRRGWTWDEVITEATGAADRLTPMLDSDGEVGLGEPIQAHWIEHYEQIRNWVYRNSGPLT
jgi:hypothetical protein